MADYLFQSLRLGFRQWDLNTDLDVLASFNADKKVMEYFPETQNKATTRRFIENQIASQEQSGYCFFPVETIDTRDLIGFIGIQKVNFESHFTPAIEIGWRLGTNYWERGYATEGATACLKWAFEKGITDEIYSFTAFDNTRSENVMKKIGMQKLEEFAHPLLPEGHPLQQHVLYQIQR